MIVDSTNPRIMADNIRELARNGGGGSDLPDVTAADNGKILGVVEGSWNKMDAPSNGYNISSIETDTGLTFKGKTIYCKLYEGEYYLTGENISLGEVGDISVLSATFLSHDGWTCSLRGRRYANTGNLTMDYMSGLPTYSTDGDILVYYYYNTTTTRKSTKRKEN